MTVADDFRAIVAKLRGWGYAVREEGGCYGRSNGLGWNAGRPVGHVNHHYVCSLNPAQSYIDGLVGNLVAGTTVNWFADVNGRAYLIGTGPMNHAGTGNSYTLDATKAGKPPPYSPARDAGNMTGNTYYSGTECQHPGDSTPWPTPMLDVMVAINAAEFEQWGLPADCAIDHYEWTSRKIDMSAGGGVNSNGWAGAELRRRVAAKMGGGPPDPYEDQQIEAGMALSAEAIQQITDVVDGRIKAHLGESAVTNPNAALNAGVMARINATDNAKFAGVAGYKKQ